MSSRQKAAAIILLLMMVAAFKAGTKLNSDPKPRVITKTVIKHAPPVTVTKTVTTKGREYIPAVCRKAITGTQGVLSGFTPLADAPQIQADIFAAARVAIFEKDIATLNKISDRQTTLESSYTNVLQDLPDNQSQALADMKACLKEVR